MSVETKNPSFTSLREAEFRLMRNSMDGESSIKAAGETYLPMPSGFKSQEDNGVAMYAAYKARAQFPEILAPTVSAMVGIIHGKEIEIEMPDSLQYLYEAATTSGLSLEAFHRRITSQILKLGRFSVLADAPQNGGEPYMCGYAGDLVINWDDDNSFYVIDDSGMVRNGYEWDEVKRFITLKLEDGSYQMVVSTDADGQFVDEVMDVRGTGGKALDRIPFVVANAVDIAPDLITPPLIGVARSALAIYQLSADYRHQLYMSGQEMLVAINGPAPDFFGAGVVHEMHGAENFDVDLKFVSPECTGIEAHKAAMSDNRDAAILSGAKLLEQDDSGVNESGKARKLRFSSETATLSSIAKVSCEVLETSLRNIAMMKGLTEAQQKQITVTPPKDLMDNTLSPQDAKALVEAWQANGFSYRTLYENLQRGGIANPERTYEDELLEADSDPEAIRQAQEEALAPSA